MSATRTASRLQRLALAVSVGFVLLFNLGQRLIGTAPDIAVFCLVPILLVTLLVGETAGLFLALLSAGLYAGLTAQWIGHGLPAHAVILNDLFKLMSFSYVALASSWLVRQRDRLHVLARTDALTGLPNYRALIERMDEELARAARYGHGLALVAIDFDHFKQYNDRLGHQEGNTLLQQVARLILLAIRQSDRAFRYGGDELVLLLPETAASAAVLLADRIRAQIAHDYGRGIVPVTASFGVACLRGHDTTAALIAAADAAMYNAKRGGGNRVELAEGTVEEAPTIGIPAEGTPLVRERSLAHS